jgi:transposase
MKYVGLDWASQAHDVTVLGEAGQVLDRWAFAHSEAGWLMTVDRLRRQGLPDELPVIVERTSGLVVDRLLSAGHPVVPVHPTAFFAARPRWGASGAKSDPGDSYKLADYLRTDGHRLRRLAPVDPGLQELQVLVRLRDDHVRARTAASNQLTAMLDAYWPGPRQLFVSLTSPIALSFLADYPTPAGAAHLAEARMAAFLRRHHYRGGKTPAELVARLRAAPVAPAGLPTATLAAMVTSQVQLLRTLQQLISDTERLIAARVGAYPRTRVLAALPGVGMINLAQLLAEVARSWIGSTALNRPPPSAVRRLSPALPARPAGSTSAGQRTPAPGRRSPASPTTLGSGTPGLPSSTPTPALAGNATHTPLASSPEPGFASSGPAGPHNSPTIPPVTCTSTSSYPPVPPPPANPAGAQARSRWSTPRLNDLDRAEHRHTIKRGGTPMAST